MAILDDSVSFTISVWSQKGSIVSFVHPDEVVPGDSFTVTVAVLNSSTSSEEYILALVNVDTNTTISTSGVFTLLSGAQNDLVTVSSIMAATDMNLRIELWRTVI